MKKIKKIYYPILAIAFVVMLIVGFVGGTTSSYSGGDSLLEGAKATMTQLSAERSSFRPANKDNAVNYIVEQLVASGYSRAVGDVEDGYADAALNGKSFILQSDEPNPTTMSETATHSDNYIAIKEINNIIVVVEGSDPEAGAVLYTANYDSAAWSQSGAETMSAAAMLEAIKTLNARESKNTLVFVFTDAEHEGAYGAYTFLHQFEGFGGIVDKIKLGVNFEVLGLGGATMVEANENGGTALSLLSGFAGNVVKDITAKEESDFHAFDFAGVNLVQTGDTTIVNTARDKVDSISDGTIKSACGLMMTAINAYKDADLSFENADVTVSYFGGVSAFGNVVVYIVGAIALVLALITIIILIKKRNIMSLLNGIIAQCFVFVDALIVGIVSYFLLGIILVGLGAMPLKALTAVTYMNIGLFIGCMILIAAAFIAGYLFVRKIYRIKSVDMARGGALALAVLGGLFAIIIPQYCFVLGLLGLLTGLTLLITTLIGERFKQKFGFDIERLFLHVWPAIALLPMIIPVAYLGSSLGIAMFVVVFATLTVFAFSPIMPYFGMLKPIFDSWAKKLPQRTIRVERVVTEKVEGAKKGRFTEVTRKVVQNEKIDRAYKNRLGVVAVSLVAVLVIVLSAVCPTPHFSTNIADSFDYLNSIYDNSLVYVYDDTATTDTEKLVVKDKVAYTYLGRVLTDLSWNPQTSAYEMDFIGSRSSLLGTSRDPIRLYKNGTKTITVSPYNSNGDSLIVLKIGNASNVEKITIDSGRTEREYEHDGGETITLELPYDDNEFASFNLVFEGESLIGLSFEYTQYVRGSHVNNRIMQLTERNELATVFADELFWSEVNFGFVLSLSSTISL